MSADRAAAAAVTVSRTNLRTGCNRDQNCPLNKKLTRLTTNNMIYRFLFVIVALVAISRASSQEADDKEQRTIQLTREMVEGLLQVLSPPCKSEMEGALGSQTEISDECKYEIQSTLAAMQNPNGQASQEATKQEQTQQPAEPVKKEPRAKRQRSPPVSTSAPTPSVSPVVYIFGFVAVFFALVGALVVYINQQKASVPVVKPKPLSKKKEEKLRQKQSQQPATRSG